MTDDDLDLSPWQPPAPPPVSLLAEAVVARVREPATAAMYEQATRTRPKWLAPSLIGAGIGALVAGAAMFAVLHTSSTSTITGDGFAKAAEVKALEDRVRALEHPPVTGTPAPEKHYAGQVGGVTPPPPSGTEHNSSIASRAIDDALSPIMSKCRHAATTSAFVKITVNVDPSGMATAVVGDVAGRDFQDCIVAGVALLHFEATAAGGTSTLRTNPNIASDPFAAPRTEAKSDCDADALEVEGDRQLALGNHDDAMRLYANAIRCRPTDIRARERIVLAECAKGDISAAQSGYGGLPETSRDSVRAACEQRGISLGMGALDLKSKPQARVFVDGVDVHQVTPTELFAPSGKHKVTYVIGEDRYTWGVTVENGKTVTLDKNLEQ